MEVYLFYLNLFWAGAAIIYDAPKLLEINPLLWPIVVICPLFPLLLALFFFQIIKKRKPNQFLLAFASIPSFVYGVVAIIYYPFLMLNEGFNWYGIGQILWVLFYSAQGLYLIIKYKINTIAISLVGLYLLMKLTLEYRNLSFGYLDLHLLTKMQLEYVYIVSLVATLIAVLFVISKRLKNN